MELDELKGAWQALNADLHQQKELNLRLLREGQGDRARRGLRPLVLGQALQMVLGAFLALGAGIFWTRHRDVPHLLATGLAMHAYGLALIFFGARMQALLARIDFGLPVVDIQRRLAELRRFYVVGGLWIGLPWWFLWIPFMALAVMGMFGVDLMALIPRGWVIGTLGLGLAGLLASLLLLRLARRRPNLARRLNDVLAGRSLREAQRHLDEIHRFETE